MIDRPDFASGNVEKIPTNGVERRADIFERSRAAGGTIEKLTVYGRVEAALVRSVSGEGATSVISSGAVALGLHLSAPNVNTFRYVGERWRDHLERPGTVSLVVPGRPFEQMGERPSEDLHVLLPGGLMREIAEEVGAAPALTELLPVLAVQDVGMSQLLSLLADEVRGGGPGGRLYAEGLANALAVYVLRRYSSLEKAQTRALTPGGSAAGVGRASVRRALEYLGDNLAGDPSLADVARVANTSERHLYRLFREATGLSPHQYVIRERVEKAKALLRRTDLTIAEVAVVSGFSHHQHLNRHFKRLVGVSPERFRREAGR